MADWRDVALGPRSVKLHERLSRQTKELPPLQEGDYVLIQNQLGNHPKRWDKRGIVVQANPATRQYKVMTFGSRRLTLRNRRFLRKFTPAYKPAGAPTGISGKTPAVETPIVPKQVKPSEGLPAACKPHK